jgi:hypothetical protein
MHLTQTLHQAVQQGPDRPMTVFGDRVGILALNSDRYHEYLLATPWANAERHELRRTQREYVEAWVGLLLAMHPDLGAGPARVRVQAALTVVNDVARTPHLRTLPGIEDALHVVGSAVLGLLGLPSGLGTSGQTL